MEEQEETNVIEFELNSSEIDEVIDKLNELKENGGHVHIDINGNRNHLLIHSEGDELN